MDTLLARYLDGELDDEEARVFLQRLDSDPHLAAELRDYERILASAQLLREVNAPSGFTQSVMEGVAEEAPPRRSVSLSPGRAARPRAKGWAWRPALAMAAVLLATFVLGRMTVGSSNFEIEGANSSPQLSQLRSTLNVGQPRAETASLVATGGASASRDFRIVRLIYSPQREDLESVSVAGSFNGWNAHSLPLKKTGGVWTTTLVLPPGAYEYMFIENGNHWVTDPLAPYTRDDGFGNRNAVLELGA